MRHGATNPIDEANDCLMKLMNLVDNPHMCDFIGAAYALRAPHTVETTSGTSSALRLFSWEQPEHALSKIQSAGQSIGRVQFSGREFSRGHLNTAFGQNGVLSFKRVNRLSHAVSHDRNAQASIH